MPNRQSINAQVLSELSLESAERLCSLSYKTLKVLDTEDNTATKVSMLVFPFVLYCQEMGIDIRQVLEKTERMLRDVRAINTKSYQALSGYMKGEFKNMTPTVE